MNSVVVYLLLLSLCVGFCVRSMLCDVILSLANILLWKRELVADPWLCCGSVPLPRGALG